MIASRTIREIIQAVAAVSTVACAVLFLPAAALAQHSQGPAHSQPMVLRQSQSQTSTPQPQPARPPVVRGQNQGQGQNQPQQLQRPQPQRSPGPAAGQSHLQYGSPAAPRQAPQPAGPAFRAGAPGQPPVYRGGQPAGGERGIAPGEPAGHLGQWMQQHQNMSPQEQQRALEREPGFNRLTSDQQARIRARLQQLNSMPPEQRQRVLNRVESMERLSPEQRQQVTRTMGQLHSLPPDRQRAVAQAFRNLRALPPDQREAAARSYGSQFSPQERDTLNNLMKSEPYLPIQRPPETPPQ